MSLRSMVDRLLGRGVAKTDVIERAELIADSLRKGDIRIVLVAKNARALAELRRLDGHARR